MLLFGLGVFALLQLWYFHKALVLADPTIVCPCMSSSSFSECAKRLRLTSPTAAFCFYNLSSITNGLVYFNQFSLIPPLHLGLVSIGIVVLLGGVWIVSIPSEGGGVDLGTWQENDDVISLPDSDTESIFGNSETRPPSIPLSSPSVRVSPLPELRGGEVTRFSTASANEPSLPSSPASHRRQITDSVLLVSSTSSPKRRRWWRRDTRSSLSPIGPGGSGSGGVQAGGGAGAGPAMVLPGGGLQIGLSPVSPGFAILPRLRRKRVVSGNSVEGGPAEGSQRNRTQRSFSEGDMSRVPNRTLSPRGVDEADEARADTGEDGNDTTRTVENGVGDEISLTRRGWRWLRKALTRRKI
jgi:magnesium transporter